MPRLVTYLMSGAAHLPYLVVSLRSLRRVYDGPVQVHAWPESAELAKRICDDPRLDVTFCPRTPKYRREDGVGGNAQFIDKIRLCQELDGHAVIYLDADTLVCKPLDPLFELLQRYAFVATQFNDWTMQSRLIRKRIERLVGREGINQFSVQFALDHALPSVNGGIFGTAHAGSLLQQWEAMTLAVRDLFIADETTLHALVAEYDLTHRLTVLKGGAFNCSPKFQPDTLSDQDVAIWHFHGDSNVRPNKSPKGVQLWWPEFQSCLQQNIGGMADWIGNIDNKWLKQFMSLEANACL